MRGSRTRTRWPLLALCSSLVVLALPLTTTPLGASDARITVAGLTPIPTNDVVVNQVITTSFDLALTQKNQRELAPFIASLTDPASKNYHHFLSPAQYARRFGASSATVKVVRDFLSSYGLRVGALSKGHNILHVSGTTRAIGHAFDAPIETVRRSDGTLVAHLTATASLPHSLAPDVTAVAGLSAVSPESTNVAAPKVVGAPSTCPSAGSTTSNTPNGANGALGYNAQQQAQLYGLSAAWSAGDTGVGQTIGVYELANYSVSDVATYFTCYGLTATLKQIPVDGGSTSSDNACVSGACPEEEATLDVEEASVLAPGAAIEVYEGTNSTSGPTDVYSQIASDNSATIVTTSWGGCEPQNDGAAQAEMPIFEEMAAQGQTMIAAAGDNGSSDCEGIGVTTPTKTPAADDPAAQPYVTGVGGLNVSSITPLTETVWNDNCTAGGCGAGGGGMSGLWTQPTWQIGPGITTSASSGAMRMVPDLSVMGDPNTGFTEYWTNTTSGPCRQNCAAGWGGIGGTSIGSPLVSALVAVAAQACNPVAGSRLGFINPSLYAMATKGFNDVTTGDNDLYGVNKYSAGPGYDMASGLGSPNGAAFLQGLCPPAFSSTLSPFALSGSATALTTGPTVSATLNDVNGHPVVNAVVDVTVTAPKGLLSIDSDQLSTQGLGKATYQVTSDATGAIAFNVSSSIAQDVAVNVTYLGQSIYTATVTFKAATIATSKPGSPTITRLTSLVAGFSLSLRAPSNTGGGPIKSYQYSLNGGATWISLAKGAKSINVTGLVKGHSYRVIARAINTVGPSSASAAKKVVTRL